MVSYIHFKCPQCNRTTMHQKTRSIAYEGVYMCMECNYSRMINDFGEEFIIDVDRWGNVVVRKAEDEN